MLAFSANLYLLKYLSDQYPSRCISFKLLTTAETQIVELTLRKTVYVHRSRNCIDNNKQATKSLNLEAFVGVRYFFNFTWTLDITRFLFTCLLYISLK